jgi:phosphate:Na+ symporter
MRRDLTRRQAEQIPMLLHCTNDVERIGDHSAFIRAITEKLNNDNIRFSAGAEAELNKLHKMLTDLAHSTIFALKNNKEDSLKKARDIQKNIFSTLSKSESGHITRINNGECRPQVGLLYLELLEEIRKIARHLENINDRAGMFYTKLPSKPQK